MRKSKEIVGNPKESIGKSKEIETKEIVGKSKESIGKS